MFGFFSTSRKMLAPMPWSLCNLKLAESVALSPTAVLARLQRLTKNGYILGYEARLNPLKLGVGMMVFVEVLLDRTTPNVFDAFKAAVQVYPEIMDGRGKKFDVV